MYSDTPTLLSINRFEGKKNVALAVESFAKVRKEHPKLRLIVAGTSHHSYRRRISSLSRPCAGGYDARLPDNVITLSNLQKLAAKYDLSQYTYSAHPLASSPTSISPRHRPTISESAPTAVDFPQILFLLNMTSSQKSYLLAAESTVALLYTPMYEHFGIVPLEAMASGIPVIATTSGGPTETIVDNGLPSPSDSDNSTTITTTGLLRPNKVDPRTEALSSLLALSSSQRASIGRAGQDRVRTTFSQTTLGESLERACIDAAKIGMPIPVELGFKKMLAFVGIGIVCFSCGFGVYVWGRM